MIIINIINFSVSSADIMSYSQCYRKTSKYYLFSSSPVHFRIRTCSSSSIRRHRHHVATSKPTSQVLLRLATRLLRVSHGVVFRSAVNALTVNSQKFKKLPVSKLGYVKLVIAEKETDEDEETQLLRKFAANKIDALTDHMNHSYEVR